MTEPRLFFFHGLESGPIGTKSSRLKEAFGEVEAPDFEGMMDIEERLKRAEEVTRGEREMVVVGSSFGGLVAALLYSRYPDRFRHYVLLAPALHQAAASRIEAMPEGAVVIHGRADEVVPLEAVREVCGRFGVGVIEVDDGHRLHGALDMMVERVKGFLDA